MQALDILHDAPLEWISDLQGVQLISSNMQRINLGGSDLRGANFWSSNLVDAHLGSTHLQNADFRHANLSGASLAEAIMDKNTRFNEDTTLPDDTRYKTELGLEQLIKFGVQIVP